mgnify:CR=1 FL=1
MPQRYRRKSGADVIAVRLALDTEGFSYRKWGGVQRCAAGDWIVDNGSDVYTVKADVFAATYGHVRDGRYRKTAPVWAERMAEAGSVATNEGVSHYVAGDYVVSHHADLREPWAVAAAAFDELYEPD